MHPAFSLIQLLDSLRDIKTIPDSSPNDSFMILKDCIADLPKVNKERLITPGLSFNPAMEVNLSVRRGKWIIWSIVNFAFLETQESAISVSAIPSRHIFKFLFMNKP
jgi:hypothetical protein